MRKIASRLIWALPVLLAMMPAPAADESTLATAWSLEWPDTDFETRSVALDEILSGGPPKDGIPSIDQPQFKPAAEITDLTPTEPVIVATVNGEARAYPLRVMLWHEIVNDSIGGVPVAVTYCPLCNAAILFERQVGERLLDFGTTGKLRKSGLVMYDRQTFSWWQQFSGEAIVGEMTGTRLTMLPARIEAFGRFAERHGDGLVLVPSDPEARLYGVNPYGGYDSTDLPLFYDGAMPAGVPPMAYVVAVGAEAWTLDLLRARGRIDAGDLQLRWEAGMNSALDRGVVADGRDIGNVTVVRRSGHLPEVALFQLTFAFVFHAFHPEGRIYTE